MQSTKDLDKFVLSKLDEAALACAESGSFSAIKSKYSDIAKLFIKYDGLEISAKKSAISDSYDLLTQVRDIINNPIPKAAPCNIAKLMMDYKNASAKSSTPVQLIPGVGPKLALALSKKGIKTVGDIFYYLPLKYEDRRKVEKISELTVGSLAVFTAKVVDFGVIQYRSRRVFEMVAADDSGSITLKWFRYNKALPNLFKRGDILLITGEVKSFNFAREMHHPEVKKVSPAEQNNQSTSNDEDAFVGIRPVYSETEGLKQFSIRKIIGNAVNNFLPSFFSPLDIEIAPKLELPDAVSAITNLHFPEKNEDLENLNSFKSSYHKRVIFEEFFYFELALAQRKKGRILQSGIKFEITPQNIDTLKSIIPFKLTGAQSRVVEELFNDMQSAKPMNRLIQGDVGSGKTIVALFAIYFAAINGYQAAIMAPTEILASQHYTNLSIYLDTLGIRSALLTSNLKAVERRETLAKIASGEVSVIIGTHAVIQESVKMRRLGLAVIDEQHRFGVVQRTKLAKMGKDGTSLQPDILIMTATPIPRTLAITVYGDLDVSIIDEMPPGRKPVQTKVFYENQREQVYYEIRRELNAGHQAYIVYPLVSESDKVDLMDATNMADHLKNDIFPDYNVGLVHGKMKQDEKNKIMNDFKAERINILVATTVIEVGIDIPTASIMVVEHAERFGLSQLHQLRGRVGRGDVVAKCILLAQYNKSQESTVRLKVMEETNDGFLIAEEDLALRGPGELLGTRQSGLPDFQVASLIRDLPILKTARKAAFELIHADPNLEHGINKIIKDELIKRMKGKLELATVG